MRKQKVIEPSEIIVDQARITKEDTSHVNPWIRFLSRFFDYALIGFIFSFFPNIYAMRYLNIIPLSYLIWIPIEAAFLCSWGYTPGKFLLKSKLSYKRKKLSFSKALRRSFLVWFRGMGMGIPFVSSITMIMAHFHLKNVKLTTWDRDEKVMVTHKPVSGLTIILSILVISFVIFFRK